MFIRSFVTHVLVLLCRTILPSYRNGNRSAQLWIYQQSRRNSCSRLRQGQTTTIVSSLSCPSLESLLLNQSKSTPSHFVTRQLIYTRPICFQTKNQGLKKSCTLKNGTSGKSSLNQCRQCSACFRAKKTQFRLQGKSKLRLQLFHRVVFPRSKNTLSPVANVFKDQFRKKFCNTGSRSKKGRTRWLRHAWRLSTLVQTRICRKEGGLR